MFSSFLYFVCDLVGNKQVIVTSWEGCTHLHSISSEKGLTKDNPPNPTIRCGFLMGYIFFLLHFFWDYVGVL